MVLYTIGFKGKSAREFFETLKKAGVRRVIDIRLNNTSQLAGFTKMGNLEYFLEQICGIAYVHIPELAPSKKLKDGILREGMPWEKYRRGFLQLMEERGKIAGMERAIFEEPCCLLCTEPTAEHCHRRLVAESLRARWPEMEIVHL